MTLKLSRYHVVTQPFFDEIGTQFKRVLFATRTSNVCAIDDASWTLLETGAFEQLSQDMVADLVEMELLVPSSEDELMTILDRNDAASQDDDTLFFSVQPTAMCQLGCHYCGQEHRNKQMSDIDQERLLERARTKLSERQFRTFGVTWFGAEPLIGLPVIRNLAPKFRALAEEFGCVYESKMVTNGLALTEAVATELVQEFDVRLLEITIDGLAEFHDARRMQKSGMPTFEKIFANTVAVARRTDLDVYVSVRCNVDAQNYESVTPLLLKFAEEGVQDRINFYVAPIHSWGNDAHTRSLSADEFAAWEIQWMSEKIELGFSTKLIPARQPITCMATRPHSELVDADGLVYNCTEVSYVPAYGTPNEYAIEHLNGQSMSGTRDRLGDFTQRVRRGEFNCPSCRMLPVCGGACPKAWQEGLEPCPSAKRNIEQRLLLSYAVSRIEQQNTVNAEALLA
ncbi:radical SAM/SPASM domain-containing protein [Myxacorys almedinensis]|uniref:radical SAM/SPASM domain-containing protein n=1 Tax=Myxacorys almedinensis TaxID=2651157 RepID=UPI00192E8937|nr:radical SAM protein [Myxacorys almedinensis]